jgi:hypothetical protein
MSTVDSAAQKIFPVASEAAGDVAGEMTEAPTCRFAMLPHA